MSPPSENKRPKRQRHHFSHTLLSIIVGGLFTLVLCEWVLGYYYRSIQSSNQMDAGFFRYHQKMGWELTPNWQGAHKHYDYEVEYKINSSGTRESGELGAPYEIAFVGDSFTFGFGVNDEETFVSLLNKGRNDSNQDFTNYGIPGTSTDQHYILIKEKILPRNPKEIFLVVYLANDLFDNLRSYPLQADFAKPYFKLQGDALELKNVPVPRERKPASVKSETLSSIVLRKQEEEPSWLERKIKRSNTYRALVSLFSVSNQDPVNFEKSFRPALSIFENIIEKMREELDQSGVMLTLVILPGKSFVESPKGVSAQYQGYLRDNILSFVKRENIQVLDLAPVLQKHFSEKGEPLYFANDGHLTVLGHKVLFNEISNRSF